MGRAFKVLGLLHPGESFERIQRGLAKRDPKARASSRELIENLLAQPLRGTVLAILEDLPDPERLARVPSVHLPAEVGEAEMLRQLARRPDELGVLARYHSTELGLALPVPDDADASGAAPTPLEIDLAERVRSLTRTVDA